MRDWQRWLEDRATHRRYVDSHFSSAFHWLRGWRNHGDVLELGPGHENDLAEAYRRSGSRVTQADIEPELPGVVDLRPHWPEGPGAAPQLPFADKSFHSVLAREVFEHVADLPTMLSEVHRVLDVHGRLWFSAPFVFPLHDYEKGDYWRLTDKAWIFLLQQVGFEREKVNVRHERMLWACWQYPASVLGWAQK